MFIYPFLIFLAVIPVQKADQGLASQLDAIAKDPNKRLEVRFAAIDQLGISSKSNSSATITLVEMFHSYRIVQVTDPERPKKISLLIQIVTALKNANPPAPSALTDLVEAIGLDPSLDTAIYAIIKPTPSANTPPANPPPTNPTPATNPSATKTADTLLSDLTKAIDALAAKPPTPSDIANLTTILKTDTANINARITAAKILGGLPRSIGVPDESINTLHNIAVSNDATLDKELRSIAQNAYNKLTGITK